MRSIVIAAVLFLAISATAQTPCPTTPEFTVTPGNPVLLTFRHSTTRPLGSPHVTISGNEIIVHQSFTDVPPPPGPPGPGNCNSRTVSLGALPAGTYQVSWNYSTPPALPGGSWIPVRTFTFAFTLGSVPALSAPVLLALALLLGSLGVIVLRR